MGAGDGGSAQDPGDGAGPGPRDARQQHQPSPTTPDQAPAPSAGEPRPSPFQPASGTAKGLFPLRDQLRGYHSLRPDVIAGVMVAALALPQGMAYAQTAGLPVVVGLYGLILPVIAYALLGSSRVLMVGPTTTTALMVAPALVAISPDESIYPQLAAMMALVVGLVFLLARVLHLGWLADYFSSAVLLGFITGLALTMIAGQVGVMLGVQVSGDTPLQQYASFATTVIGGKQGLTAAIGVTSLLLLLAGKRWFPKFPMLLVLTVGAIVVSGVFDLAGQGVTVVGDIPAGLPSLSWPGVGLELVLEMIPVAVGIALVGFSDAILTARTLAGTRGAPVDADQELLALSGLNVAAGLSGSFPLGSSGSRSAVNVRLGGTTQVVGLAQAATVVVALLVLTPALELLPKAVLAAVIIFAALSLVDVKAWVALWRGSRGELAIAGITVLGMLTVGLLPALGLAVLLSVVDVVRRSAEPRDAVLGWSARHGRFVDVEPRHDALLVPGVVVYRIDDRLFFANARYFAARVEQAVQGSPTPVKAVVFDAEAVSQVDASAAATLKALVDDLDSRGIEFVVARARVAVRERLDRFGLTEQIPAERRFPTVRAAVLATSGYDVDTLT